jgi:hypothetical protein
MSGQVQLPQQVIDIFQTPCTYGKQLGNVHRRHSVVKRANTIFANSSLSSST